MKKFGEKILAFLDSCRSFTNIHLFHWLVIGASLILTLFAWDLSRNQTKKNLEKDFNREADQIVALIIERMGHYEDALWSGVGLINSFGINQLDRKIWRIYAETLQIEKKYPGINGIGVILYTDSQKNLNSLEVREKKSFSEFSVYPEHNNSDYFPIVYVEPENINFKAIGLDIAHEENRYLAALKAKDSGEAQITGPIILVQDNEKTPGFLFYTPFYFQDQSTGKLFKDRKFGGLVYAPFIVKNLMLGTLNVENRRVNFSISDSQEFIVDEHRENGNKSDQKPMFKKKIDVNLYGRSWVFDIRSNLNFRKGVSFAQSNMILVGGAIIDFLLFLLFVGMARSNRKAISYASQVTKDLKLRSRELEGEIEIRRIAERKAEEASQAKSKFLTSMSHELRTPLNGIIGFSEIIMEEAKEDELVGFESYAEKILKSGNYLLSLINSLLDISKIESGTFDLHYEKILISDVINDVKDMTNSLLESKSISFNLIYDKRELEIETDIIRLKQMLTNLISNSIKFSSEGEIFLIVTKVDGYIEFTVKDSGPGIPDGMHEVIFDRFIQVHDTSLESLSGTGLGLPITRGLARKMGGDCYSLDRKQGAEISLILPQFKPSVKSDKNKLIKNEYKNSKNDVDILIIDDDEMSTEVVVKRISDLGFVAKGCFKAEDALQAVIDVKPRLILLDINMPVINGFTLLKKLKSHPRLKDIPVAMISIEIERAKAIDGGAIAMIEKPLSKWDLKDLVDHVFEKKAS